MVFTIREEDAMKFLRYAFVGLALGFPASGIAGVLDVTVDEETFRWENAMALSMADPCASYLAPTYYSGGHEAHYDDDGNDLRF